MSAARAPHRPQPTPAEGALPAGRGWRVALLLVLVAGLGVRLWYGSFEPHAGRFFDERYALENVGGVLHDGLLRPANGYHPTLSYLPQVLLLGTVHLASEVGILGEARILEDRPVARRTGGPTALYPFSPLAFRLGRGLQAVLGTLVILVTFLIASRFGSPLTGVLAAAPLVLVPLLVRQSSLINEDIGVVLTAALAFYWSLLAVARPSWRRYLLAGAGVGLATATKFLAPPVALPLVVGTLLSPFAPLPRRLLLLVGAGAASIAVFLLFNPYLLLIPDLYRTDFDKTIVDYASAVGPTRLDVFLSAYELMLAPDFLGPLAGTIALAGLAFVVVRGLRHRAPEEWMLLSLLVGFPLVYALLTRTIAPHNWLLLVPLFAVLVGRLLEPLLAPPPRFERMALAAALGVAFAGLAGSRLYGVVPPTLERAAGVLRQRLDPTGGGVVYRARSAGDRFNLTRASKAVVTPEALADLPTEVLAAADAVVLDRSDPAGMPVHFLAHTTPAEVVTLEPRPLFQRGPPLTLLIAGWRQTRMEGLELTAGADDPPHRLQGRWRGLLPEWVTFGLLLDQPPDAPLPALVADGRSLPLYWVRPRSRGTLFVTPRTLWQGDGVVECVFPADWPHPPRVELLVWQWERP